MFCKNCGRQLSDDESFCPGCGTKRAVDTFGDGRSSADMKNLPNYAKESDLHQSGHAIDSDRKKFSLSDSGQKKFSLSDSGQNKFSLSGNEKKFSLSDKGKGSGDGIVRITANREPPPPPKAPTGFVNPLKDSGKTVFHDEPAAPQTAPNGGISSRPRQPEVKPAPEMKPYPPRPAAAPEIKLSPEEEDL